MKQENEVSEFSTEKDVQESLKILSESCSITGSLNSETKNIAKKTQKVSIIVQSFISLSNLIRYN